MGFGNSLSIIIRICGPSDAPLIKGRYPRSVKLIGAYSFEGASPPKIFNFFNAAATSSLQKYGI